MQPERSDCWSRGNQIYFLDGKAWGISPECRRVIIGKEKEIQDMLLNNKQTGNNLIDGILLMETNNW